MPNDAVTSIRTRAELARRLSTELKDPHAIQSLREIAASLDAEADDLENNVVRLEEAVRPKKD